MGAFHHPLWVTQSTAQSIHGETQWSNLTGHSWICLGPWKRETNTIGGTLSSPWSMHMTAQEWYNDTTDYSSCELVFGRQPKMPVDLVLGIHPDMETHNTHSEYVKGLRPRLQEYYSLASKSSKRWARRTEPGSTRRSWQLDFSRKKGLTEKCKHKGEAQTLRQVGTKNLCCCQTDWR